jgi:hypothetical protein
MPWSGATPASRCIAIPAARASPWRPPAAAMRPSVQARARSSQGCVRSPRRGRGRRDLKVGRMRSWPTVYAFPGNCWKPMRSGGRHGDIGRREKTAIRMAVCRRGACSTSRRRCAATRCVWPRHWPCWNKLAVLRRPGRGSDRGGEGTGRGDGIDFLGQGDRARCARSAAAVLVGGPPRGGDRGTGAGAHSPAGKSRAAAVAGPGLTEFHGAARVPAARPANANLAAIGRLPRSTIKDRDQGALKKA